MNVRTLCLSILYEGDATGYEIRRLCVEGECAYFTEASFGSIYPALAKLEEEGLVTSRTELQDGKPAKNVFSITTEGRQALIEQLMQPLGSDVFRSPFLLFARFAKILPRDLVEQRLNEYLARSAKEREILAQALANTQSNPADTWVINYGITVMGVADQYIRSHMQELIALAQTEPADKAAE
jgi:PadR family transcriptional regulator AphA